MAEKKGQMHTGPSKAGIIVAVMSVTLATILVVGALPIWLGIVVLLIWWLVCCPFLMKIISKLDFISANGYEYYAAFFGGLIWIGFSLLLATHYIPGAWWLGLLLSVFTAIIIAKVGHHWNLVMMSSVGLVLGVVIPLLNELAIKYHAPLATPALSIQQLWVWPFWGWVLIAIVLTTFIGAISMIDRLEDLYIAQKRLAEAQEMELRACKTKNIELKEELHDLKRGISER